MSLLIFDSGIGGLGVAAEIRRLSPATGMDYLADTDFYPYGEKPDAVLTRRILTVIAAGIAKTNPQAVVIACNTASTIALAALRESFPVPFIGCVPPIKPAAAASRTGQIGLLATPATIRRPYLQALVRDFAGNCTVHSLGTPLLADLAEQKFRGTPVDTQALAAAIAPLFAAPNIDSVALGCTHYTFLLPELTHLRPDLNWFDPAGAVARQTLKIAPAPPGGGRFFVTGPVESDAILSRRLADHGFPAAQRLGVPAA